MKTDVTELAANPLPHPSEEGFITKEVVAERLSVTPETVRRWASAGKLPSHHFGRRLRFKWSEVRAALAYMTKGDKGDQ